MKRFSVKNVRRYAALILCGMLTLSACSSGTAEATSAAAKENEAASEAAGGAEEAKASDVSGKDELVVGLSTEPSSLDPHNVNMVTAFMIDFHIFDSLFVCDANRELQPSLATDYEWVDDTTLRVSIRDDVDFSNGDHMTAEDVVYSIQRACEKPQSATNFEYFDGPNTTAVDDYTVEIKFKSPYPNALRVLADGRGSIVCKRAIEEMGEDNYGRAPVGSGKFIVTNWSASDRIELTRNDNYWGDKPAYKNLTFRIIAENANRIIELETGAVDIAFDVPASDMERLKENADINIVEGASSTMNHIVINTVNFDTLKDVKVRTAMHMALDKEAILQTVYKGLGNVATSLAPEAAIEYAKVGPSQYDPEGAKALIEESGFDTSQEIVLQIYKNDQISAMAEMIANMWTAIGLNAKIEILDRATLVTNNSSGKTPMCITTVTVTGGSIEPVFRQWERPASGFTDDEDLRARLKAVKGIMDDDERLATYAELQKETWDLSIVIPICVADRIFGVRSYVQNFEFNPDNKPDLSKVTFG